MVNNTIDVLSNVNDYQRKEALVSYLYELYKSNSDESYLSDIRILLNRSEDFTVDKIEKYVNESEFSYKSDELNAKNKLQRTWGYSLTANSLMKEIRIHEVYPTLLALGKDLYELGDLNRLKEQEIDLSVLER